MPSHGQPWVTISLGNDSSVITKQNSVINALQLSNCKIVGWGSSNICHTAEEKSCRNSDINIDRFTTVWLRSWCGLEETWKTEFQRPWAGTPPSVCIGVEALQLGHLPLHLMGGALSSFLWDNLQAACWFLVPFWHSEHPLPSPNLVQSPASKPSQAAT